MNELVKYFNISNDTDLIWLVIKALSLCVLLMVIYTIFPTIKNVVFSFFSFSKPKIKKWVVQVSDSPNGKKVHVVWNVSGAFSIRLEPVLKKNNVFKKLNLLFGGLYAFFLLPFKLKHSKSKHELSVKKIRFKNLLLLNTKLSIPQGSHSFYLNDDKYELTFYLIGIWGTEKSSVVISNAIVNEEINGEKLTKESTESSKEFNELIYYDLLRKYNLSQKRSNTHVLNEIFSSQFKEKNIVTKGEKLQKIHNQYKEVINSSYKILLKPKRIQVQSNFKFINHTKEFLNFREHQLDNNQF
jgi:hypothetical protein